MPARKNVEQAPTNLPNTPPLGSGTESDRWLVHGIGKLEANLAGLQTQLNRMEAKLDEVEKEVSGHGKWMHTLKAFAVVVLILFGWVLKEAVWPYWKSRLGIP